MFQLLTNTRVFAPEPLGTCCVLIAGEKIVWMGKNRPDLPKGPDVVEIDLSNKTLIPGFIDPHLHLTGGGGEAGFHTRVSPLVLSDLTSAGITTAVGVLGTDDLNRSPEELLATARAFNHLGITAYCYTGGYHLPPRTITGSVRGDIVHIDLMIGVGELAISDHRSSQPTLDEFIKVASEAHVASLMSLKAGVMHIHLGDGKRGLELVRKALEMSEIPARVFYPTHVNRKKALFREALDLVARGCSIDITAFPVGPDEDAFSAADAFEIYQKKGLPKQLITLSSDGGGCLPVFDAQGQVTSLDVGKPRALWETFKELIVTKKHPIETVLGAFTLNISTLLRLQNKGRIHVGADADLIAFDDHTTITDVMARGRWYMTDKKLLSTDPFRKSAQGLSL